MSNQTFFLDETLYNYLCAISLREPPLLEQLRQETGQMPMAQMQIAPEQGQFLRLLLRLLGARRAIEVGVFTGYSSLCIAESLPEDGYLLACDLDADWTAVARRYWQAAGVADRMELRLAPALQTLDERIRVGEDESYDFAFIDADKENYLGYYERLLQLIRPGGLIAVDNTLWSGRVADASDHDADTAAIRAFNKRVHGDVRVDLSLVPIADGLTLLRKKA